MDALIIIAILLGIAITTWLIVRAILKYKRNKIIKAYNLEHILRGYFMFRTPANPSLFILLDGHFGASATHLVFDHRNSLEPMHRKLPISKVQALEIFEYDVSEEIFDANEEASVRVHGVEASVKAVVNQQVGSIFGGAVGRAVWRALGGAITNSYLKMKRNEHVLRITCTAGDVSFFYYKNSNRNTDVVNEIQEYVQGGQS